MKPILTTLFCLGLLVQSFAQNSSPVERVSAAYSPQEISGFTAEQIQELNLRAEYLCWFEEPKAVQPVLHQMVLRNGQAVTLTPAQIADFNPLLYVLPQEEVACGNLYIADTEGQVHMLVVRSVQMMNKQAERVQIKQNKKAGK